MGGRGSKVADNRGDPQLSWQTVVAAITVVGLLAVAQWTIFQNQFANVDKTLVAMRAQDTELKATFDKYLTIREHTEYREGIRAELDDAQRRLSALETAQASIINRQAHDAVEDRTFQAVAKATDDRIVLLQNQITDINRQIAAALIIIDNNAASVGVKRSQPSLPP
jgi:DICT domain-containing protein